MVEKFLGQTQFASYEDFCENLQLRMPRDFNFAYDVVDRWAADTPHKEALLWIGGDGQEKRLTFKDVSELSDAGAAWLTSLGLRRGDRVLLMLKRRWQWWIAMMSLHKIGAVAIPATHLLTAPDIEYRCHKANVKAIIAAVTPDIIKHVEEAVPRCPGVELLISAAGAPPSQKWHDFDAGLALRLPWQRPALVNHNASLMLLYFTSGTSGEPKMVAHNFLYPLGHLVTAKYWHCLGPDDLHLTVADTGWGKAVWGKLYGQWLCGADVFVNDFDRFDARRLLELMAKYKVTSFCAPPTVYRFMVREHFADLDLSALRQCTTAGEALNPMVFERWKELTGIPLREAFGQTETTLTVGTFPWMEPRPGSMGKPNPQYQLEVLGADDLPVPDGQEGELCIRLRPGHEPAGLFMEYLDDAALTRQVRHHGYYHTGDVVRRDADGYLWFVGRRDDVIKSSGYRIGPFEVENACMSHPAVVECAITAVPDAIRGQIVKATIVLAKGWKATQELAKEIQTHVKRVTAPYKYPRLVEFVNELPKTISGKIRHAEIRRRDARG